MVKSPVTRPPIPRRIIIGSISFAFLALLFVIFITLIFGKRPGQAIAPTAELNVIPASTPTDVLVIKPIEPTPTSSDNVGGPFTIGMYVQIAGTEGVGLYIREAPGVKSPARFLGMDSEVFQVKDGARQADGLLWYLLEAPYDVNRSGWAAADYLNVVSSGEGN